MTVQRGDETFTLSGTEYPFLFPETGGALGCRSVSPFAPKTATGDRSYQDYEWISATALTDLSGGMGQDRLVDATQYFASQNVDARGGRLVLGPLLTVSSACVGLSAHATALLTGTYTAATLGWQYIDVAQPKVGAACVIPADVSEIAHVWLPLALTNAAATITVGLYNSSGGLPNTQLATTTISRATYRANGAWTPATFAPAVSVVPNDTYWISVEYAGTAYQAVAWYGAQQSSYAYANAASDPGTGWTAITDWHLLIQYDDGQVRPDGPVQFALGAGEDGITRLWAWAGQHLYYVDPDSSALIPVTDGSGSVYTCDADITAATWYQSASDTYAYLYLALGDSTDMVRFDGNIGTEQWAAVTGVQARALAVHDGLLWRADERNQVSGSANGTTFGTAVNVGDCAYPVVKMQSWNGVLIVGKQDGLYKVEHEAVYPTSSAPTTTRLVDFTSQLDPASFAILLEHQGSLVFNIGQSLLLYTLGNLLTIITPDSGLNLSITERSTYQAAFSALSALWVLAEGPFGAASALLAYVDGHWHSLTTLPRAGDLARGLYLDPGLYDTTPRLWYSAGLDCGYLLMPTTTQKRWLWDTATWAESGHLDTSWLDGGIRSINKDWYQVTLHVEQVVATTRMTRPPYRVFTGPKVEVWWRPDEATAWALVGTVTTAGITTLNFPANSYSPKLQLRLYLYRGVFDATSLLPTTPIVEAIIVKHIERPEEYRTLTRTYYFSSGQTWRNGLPTGKSLVDWIADLATLRTAAEPISLSTWYGGSYTGHIVDYDIREVREALQDEHDRGSMFATVRFQELV